MSERKKTTVKRWGILWRQENKLDGKTEHIYFQGGFPILCYTRKQAQARKQELLGYIAERKDLQREPYGWKIPKVVKIEATYKVIK